MKEFVHGEKVGVVVERRKGGLAGEVGLIAEDFLELKSIEALRAELDAVQCGALGT